VDYQPSVLSSGSIEFEIGRNRPIEIGIIGSTGHAMLIVGWQRESDRDFIVVLNDPWGDVSVPLPRPGKRASIPYADLIGTGYDGRQWRHSWFGIER
jgi:hypothetical protein